MTKTKTKTNHSIDPNLTDVSGWRRDKKINTNNDPKTWLRGSDDQVIFFYNLFNKIFDEKKQRLLDMDKRMKEDGGSGVPDVVLKDHGKWEKDNIDKLVYIMNEIIDFPSTYGQEVIDSYEKNLSEKVDVSLDDLIEEQKPFVELYRKHGLIEELV